MVHIGWALFMALIISFIGFTPALLGWAAARSGIYPAWLGWVAVVLGLASVVTGVVGTLDGASVGFIVAFYATSGLLTLWVLVLGVMLGRRAATVPA